MPLDTVAKRASTFGIGLPFRLVLPWADGTIDRGDRQHISGLYSGIEIGEVIAEIIRVTGPMSITNFGPFGISIDGVKWVTPIGPFTVEKEF